MAKRSILAPMVTYVHISVKIPVPMLTALGWLVKSGVFSSRSEAIREALRMLLKEYFKAEVTEMQLRFPYAKKTDIHAYTVAVKIEEG